MNVAPPAKASPGDGSMDEMLCVVWIGCGAAQGPMAQRWLFMTFLLSDAFPSGGQHRWCVARKGVITFPGFLFGLRLL